MKALNLFLALIFLPIFAHSQEESLETIVLIDKKKYELHLANHLEDGSLKIFKTYPVTTGKNSGDKMIEGDLKSPEGIYRFTQKFTPPQIKPKFGAMAFYMNYPNFFDKQQKKTGFDIMLHSTDDLKRLEKPQDSDGCFVVNDDRIKEIDPFIKPLETYIIVYDELKPEYLTPEGKSDIKEAFNKWLNAWTSKDIETYINSYSDTFRSKGMNKDQYKAYKELLNKKYHEINVEVSNVKFYKHPKYNIVTYTQDYSSTYKNGQKAFSANSKKMLYLVPEDGALKIAYEGN